jgi:hypothetical protein
VITYINPIIAVILGVSVLGERPGAGAVAGLLLILAGSWLSTDGRLPPGIMAVLERTRTRRVSAGEIPIDPFGGPPGPGFDAALDSRGV